ncbi:MAG: hypothetical protein ABSF64_36570 [Bryobacteraceae bacterium]
MKEFFLRLQEGMSLTSSEKLNAVHSKLRDFCRKSAEHAFFTEVIAVPNTRYAHFDIMAKVAAIEVEGIATGLRLDDVKQVFVSHNNFASTSAVAKRIRAALDFLHTAFKNKGTSLRTRTIVQSVVTLACKIVATGRSTGVEAQFEKFLVTFTAELAVQIEMGPQATDTDYIGFQYSVNANVKGGAQARQEILLRKLFRIAPDLADIFDPSIISESGISARINTLGSSITQSVYQINQKFSAKNGEDLFKATNKTAQALVAIGKPIKTLEGYEALIDDLHFLFRESAGTRLGTNWPSAFVHVNDLRTDLRHDVDHGDAAKVRAKKRKAGTTFTQYAGGGTPDTVDPIKFSLIQVNLLGALEVDLRGLLLTLP